MANMRHLPVVVFSFVLASTVTAQGRNLLFYGNSYTYYSWGYGVPELDLDRDEERAADPEDGDRPGHVEAFRATMALPASSSASSMPSCRRARVAIAETSTPSWTSVRAA